MNKAAVLADPVSIRPRFTVAEYVQICNGTDMRLELVDGELERMNPPMSGHSTRQGDVFAALRAIDRDRTKVEAGIQLDGSTVLTCDVLFLREPVMEERFFRPEEVALAVEIAQTTIARDKGFKRERYAAAGIPTYWIVDGARRVVHVHREPVDGDYAQVSTVRLGERLAVPGTDQTIVIG